MPDHSIFHHSYYPSPKHHCFYPDDCNSLPTGHPSSYTPTPHSQSQLHRVLFKEHESLHDSPAQNLPKILGVKSISLSKAHPALQDWPLPDPLTSSPASLLSHCTVLAFFPFFLMLGVFPLPGTYPCTLFPNLIQNSASLISSLQSSFLTIPSPVRKRELSCPTVYTQVWG